MSDVHLRADRVSISKLGETATELEFLLSLKTDDLPSGVFSERVSVSFNYRGKRFSDGGGFIVRAAVTNGLSISPRSVYFGKIKRNGLCQATFLISGRNATGKIDQLSVRGDALRIDSWTQEEGQLKVSFYIYEGARSGGFKSELIGTAGTLAFSIPLLGYVLQDLTPASP